MSRFGSFAVMGGMLVVGILLAWSVISPFGWGSGIGPWMMLGWGFPFMGLGMLVFWMFILCGLGWLVRSVARGAGRLSIRSHGEAPLDILNARYSRGEITKAQFEEMKSDLGL